GEGQQEAAGPERRAARPQDVGDRRRRSCWRPAHHEEALGQGGPAQRLQQSGPDPHQSGRGGAPPGAPGPCRGPGASWDRGWWEDKPAQLDMFSGAAQEGLLGCGCRVLRVRLLGRLHAARQADFQDLRRTVHPDVVCHQLELSVLPIVLRRTCVQIHREAVYETEIQGMLSVLWRQWLDSESVLYQGSTFWCSLDSHKLPVLTRNKEDKRHRRLRPVLLQQIICFLAVVDCSQGQIHGSEDRGRHPCHRWHCHDDLCRWLPQSLSHWHSPGGGLCFHVSPLQAAAGQRQVRRSGLIPVHLGCVQHPLHHLHPRHPLFHQGGVLELLRRHSMGKPLWVFHSLIDIQYCIKFWNCCHVSHADVSWNCPQCTCKCSGRSLHQSDSLQRGPGHRHHHYRPGLPPPAPSRRVGCLVDQVAHPPQ
ncbi:solute carrier family 35, member F3, isoform CRA_b, partial [Mus musculus]